MKHLYIVILYKCAPCRLKLGLVIAFMYSMYYKPLISLLDLLIQFLTFTDESINQKAGKISVFVQQPVKQAPQPSIWRKYFNMYVLSELPNYIIWEQ